jgi:DnaB-like helicase C terminal domain
MERINTTLQENLLVTLCYDDRHGRIVANQVNPEHFEGDYRTIAEEAIAYWRKYGMPPGDHTPDLVSDIIDDPKNKRHATYSRILAAMKELSGTVNTAYVMDQLNIFTRMQRLKAGILESAEKLNLKDHMAVHEVEEIWNALLRVRENNYDPGMRLTDLGRMMTFFSEENSGEFTTGIYELDSRGIVPARNKVMIFLAPPGKGKTWWLVNLAKQGILQRKRVLFVSLEMGEEELIKRIYQALFSVPSRNAEDMSTMRLRQNEHRKLVGFEEDIVEPEFTLDSPMVREELLTRLSAYGSRYENLIVKRFAPRSVTVRDLRGYLNNLELVEKFIPDLVILDYMGRVKTDLKNHRLNLGAEFEDFRGLCIERHMAGATAHQVNKTGALSNQVRSTHVSEDFSFIMTADNILTYSASEAEINLGLARLYVAKARSEKDHFGVIITQKYGLGQFVISSALMIPKYNDLLKEVTGMEDATEDDSDYEEKDE